MSTAQASTTQPLQFSLKIPPKGIKPPTINEQHSYSQPPLIKNESFNLCIPHIEINEYPLPHKRIEGIRCNKTIIYGNITHRLEGSPDYSAILPTSNNSHNNSFDTHNGRRTSRTNTSYHSYETEEWFRWTVYVRGPQNEDLSYFIEKVVFILHETYVNPIRVIEAPPFEVTECGWGQFEVKIEIYFHSIPSVNPLNDLSLFNHNYNNNNSNNNNNNNSKKRKLFNHNPNNNFKPSNKRRKMDELCANKQQKILSMFTCADGLPTEADSDGSSTSSFGGYDNKVVFLHSLRLYPKPNSDEDLSKKGIIEEKYATIVFNDPYYYLYKKLWLGPQRMIKNNHPFYEKYWKNKIINVAQKEQQLIGKISKAHKELIEKIKESKKEYQELLLKSESKTKH